MFVKGKSGNPAGSKKGARMSGRALMLRVLDGMLSRPAAARLMHDTMEARMQEDPVEFFREFVMPLLPKEQLIKMEEVEKAPLRIILTSDGAAVDVGTTHLSDESMAAGVAAGAARNGNGRRNGNGHAHVLAAPAIEVEVTSITGGDTEDSDDAEIGEDADEGEEEEA